MSDSDAVRDAILAAVDQLNAQREGKPKIGKTRESPLYDQSARLDSLELVTLVVAVEQKVGKALGVSLTLASDKAFSQKRSPFRTVGALTDFVAALVKERKAPRR